MVQYCFHIHYLQKLFCYLCHLLIYYMWNITSLFISSDKWLVELYRTDDFPTLLNLKMKLRKNYLDSLILIILDLYLWFFCFLCVCESFTDRLERTVWLLWFWIWDLRWNLQGSLHGYLYSYFKGQMFVLPYWNGKCDLL